MTSLQTWAVGAWPGHPCPAASLWSRGKVPQAGGLSRELSLARWWGQGRVLMEQGGGVPWGAGGHQQIREDSGTRGGTKV